jgi:hypothetical protein
VRLTRGAANAGLVVGESGKTCCCRAKCGRPSGFSSQVGAGHTLPEKKPGRRAIYACRPHTGPTFAVLLSGPARSAASYGVLASGLFFGVLKRNGREVRRYQAPNLCAGKSTPPEASSCTRQTSPAHLPTSSTRPPASPAALSAR